MNTGVGNNQTVGGFEIGGEARERAGGGGYEFGVQYRWGGGGRSCSSACRTAAVAVWLFDRA